jgi:hypothetical protein
MHVTRSCSQAQVAVLVIMAHHLTFGIALKPTNRESQKAVCEL